MTGRGNSRKWDTFREAYKRWPNAELVDDNEAEAQLIAEYAATLQPASEGKP